MVPKVPKIKLQKTSASLEIIYQIKDMPTNTDHGGFIDLNLNLTLV